MSRGKMPRSFTDLVGTVIELEGQVFVRGSIDKTSFEVQGLRWGSGIIMNIRDIHAPKHPSIEMLVRNTKMRTPRWTIGFKVSEITIGENNEFIYKEDYPIEEVFRSFIRTEHLSEKWDKFFEEYKENFKCKLPDTSFDTEPFTRDEVIRIANEAFIEGGKYGRNFSEEHTFDKFKEEKIRK